MNRELEVMVSMLIKVHEERKVLEARERELTAEIYEMMKGDRIEAIHTMYGSVSVNNKTNALDLVQLKQNEPEFYDELKNEINLQKLNEEDPDLFSELLTQYPKQKKDISSISIETNQLYKLDELY